jgi:hypothetical protein
VADKFEELGSVFKDIQQERISEQVGGGLLVVLELLAQRWRVCNSRRSRYYKIPLMQRRPTFNESIFQGASDLVTQY